MSLPTSKGAATPAVPFLFDSFATRARFAPLPRAWLGYASCFTDRPVVRICAWCPDKPEAERQAQEAGHAITHGLCPRCTVNLWNESLMPTDEQGAIASAQLLANSLGEPVSVYRRIICAMMPQTEYAMRLASEAAPSGFALVQTASPHAS